MKSANYRVIMRDESIDVDGDHHDYDGPLALGGTRPPLVISKNGETVAVFPHGEWKGLLILDSEAK